MPKVVTKYVCSNCGAESPKWIGKCPNCNEWNTFVEEITKKESSNSLQYLSSKNIVKPMPLSAIADEKFSRIKTGIEEFDRTLGGGIVPSSMVLIGGEPGIGKSTILTEIAGILSLNYKVLYVSAEESCSQLKLRYKRLNIDSKDLLVMNETVMENIEASLDDIDFLIIDSIQAVYLESMNSSAGSVGQVKECASSLMRIAKQKHITVFIIGHVTKEGAIAGPKTLEHIMDTVLYIEGESEHNYRILRAVKNRFGSVNEVGVFEMRETGLIGVKNYSGIFISETRGENAGSVVTPSISGNRCLPVEIQSLVAKTAFGLPRRMSVGIDYNKMILMLAVIEKKGGIPFFNQDVYLNAMGGMKLNEPSVDLAILLSLASSAYSEPIEATVACFGEVGLTGEVRAVTQADKRVKECINLGFKKIIVPYSNMGVLEKYKNSIEIVPVKYISQAIRCINKSYK